MSKAAFFRPIREKILVELAEAPKVSKGGIHLPDNASYVQPEPQRAIVLHLGTGERIEGSKETRSFEVKEGDEVYIMQYAGHAFERDGKKYKIVQESEVLGVLEG